MQREVSESDLVGSGFKGKFIGGMASAAADMFLE